MVCILLARVPHFNTQPHKEADEQEVCCEYDRVISTHSLTRRLTLICLRFRLQLSHFNSQPHKEADSCIASTMAFLVYFNSQPHKEADFPVGLVYFHRFLFQLTASQGG